MIDRLFTAALTFCLLAGGTAAIVTEFVASGPQPIVVQLPAVSVTAQRSAPATEVARTDATEPAMHKVQ